MTQNDTAHTADLSIENLIQRLYTDRHAVGKTGKAFDSVNISTPNNLKTIMRLMQTASPLHTLEIGMCFGGSSVVFGAMHRMLSPVPALRHVCIDPNEGIVWDHVGCVKIEEAGLSEFIELIEDKSSIVLPRLLKEGRKFGIIYIDGSHLFEDVFVDAYFSARLLDDGGFLLFDDSAFKHIAKVLRFIDVSMPGLQRQPDPSLRQRIAGYLGRRQLTIYRRIGEVERDWNVAFRDF